MLTDDQPGRVAWLTNLYIPEGRHRQGFGMQLMLMTDLFDLWHRAGVAEARLTATADGIPAYEAWGFVADQSRDRPEVGLQRMRLKLC
jgi:hypothetical protein